MCLLVSRLSGASELVECARVFNAGLKRSYFFLGQRFFGSGLISFAMSLNVFKNRGTMFSTVFSSGTASMNRCPIFHARSKSSSKEI
jgi:hypothetical protein